MDSIHQEMKEDCFLANKQLELKLEQMKLEMMQVRKEHEQFWELQNTRDQEYRHEMLR